MIQLKTRTQSYIFFTTLVLLGWGLVMVASSSMYHAEQRYGNSYYFLLRQVIWMVIGLVGMLWIMQKDYQGLRKNSKFLLFIAACLLIFVFVPGIGKVKNGAARWIGFSFFQFQPSEFAKIVLLIYMADVLSRKPEKQITNFKTGFVPIMLVMCIISALVVKEPDLGTAVLMVLLGWMLCLVAGMRKTHLFSMISLTIPVAAYEILKHKHQLVRILVFLHPEQNQLGDGYQISQSLIAIGSGGLWGRGLGQGLQKYGFLPDGHTDFIFSIMSEEIGFIGVTVVLLLFAFLIWQGIRVAVRSSDLFATLLAAGVTAMIACQVSINTGMALSLLPTKGMPLPFISYGGSSLVFTLFAMGILLNVAQYISEPNKEK
jgi:cell division protein FtsW